MPSQDILHKQSMQRLQASVTFKYNWSRIKCFCQIKKMQIIGVWQNLHIVRRFITVNLFYVLLNDSHAILI